jgi:murein DD-endopeptidase MepM/ murein hydrolase activator NlpD
MNAPRTTGWLMILALAALLAAAPSLTRAGPGPDAPGLQAPEHAGIGRAVELLVYPGIPVDQVRLTWLGRTFQVPVETDGEKPVARILLGTDVLYEKPGDFGVRVAVPETGVRLEHKIRFGSREFPVQRLTLPPEMATPPPEMIPRIKRERRAVGAALRTWSSERLWSLPLTQPVRGRVSTIYGVRRFINGLPRNPHRGMDLAAPGGTPIKACAPGRVILVADHYYAGRCVYLDHGLGVVSMYFHLKEPGVREGQVVDAGEIVGLVGSSGRVTGPHLHFGISVLGRLVDPAPLFNNPGSG